MNFNGSSWLLFLPMNLGFNDKPDDSRVFVARVAFAGLLVLLALTALVLRLVHLQVNDHAHFSTLSEDNRIKLRPLPPSRGLIYDANGLVLADNVPSYSLAITPEKVPSVADTIDALAAIVPISDFDRERFSRLLPARRRYEAVPIRLDLSDEERAAFAVHGHRFPGVDIHADLTRYYPEGLHTAHVVGYVGRINEQEMERINTSNYAGTTHMGKVGLEKAHEDWLHGQIGYEEAVVNARGRVLERRKQKDPIPGRDLHLFLDMDLQKDATAALGDERGAVVAIDPQTGGVLAMVSVPSYDPNPFVGGISVAAYAALRDHLDTPLYNRAIRGQYPPGSTVKPFVALAGLATGEVTTRSGSYCGGYFQLPGQSHRYRCWRKSGHGTMAMEAAIVQSCDVYFYRLANDLGIYRMNAYLADFGFGSRTGADIADEAGGLLPTPEWKERVRKSRWYPGETLIVGIGQGAFLATPLQLAAATAAMANSGTYIVPRFVRATRTGIGAPLVATPMVKREIPDHDESHWQAVIAAMLKTVEAGTARRIRSDAYKIAGKTGTSQVFTIAQNARYNAAALDKRLHDHALFVAFAPVDNPAIAVAVIVENGGGGGATAAPIARAVLDSYLLGKRVIDLEAEEEGG